MLGTGKVAEVWRCDELATGRQVAVKFQVPTRIETVQQQLIALSPEFPRH
jgi:hypothetical protein